MILAGWNLMGKCGKEAMGAGGGPAGIPSGEGALDLGLAPPPTPSGGHP